MRNAFMLAGLAVVALGIGVLGFRYDGSGSEAAPVEAISGTATTTVEFQELARGTSSTVEKRVNYLITTSEGLAKLWKMTDASGTPPKVDFLTSTVIGIFAGEQTSGGYTIAVDKIEEAERRMVAVTLTRPGASCVVTQAITTPYQIIVVPSTSLEYAHTNASVEASCP